MVGLWVSTSAPANLYPPVIFIKDRAPEIERSVYQRYYATFLLNEVFFKCQVSYNDKRTVILRHRDEPMFSFRRISPDTLKMIYHRDSYHWIRQ